MKGILFNSMEEIEVQFSKACLLVKEQWDRNLSSIIVKFFPFSYLSRLSTTQIHILTAIIVVGACYIWWLIFNELFSNDQHNKRARLKNMASSSISDDEKLESLSSSTYQNDASSSSSSIPAMSNALKMKQPMVTSEASQSSEIFCDICMDTKSQSEMFSNSKVCSHVYCSDCICQHVSTKIKEKITKVKCPDPKCKGVIGPEHCRYIIPKEVLERWEDALCESLILGAHKFYCPFKDCSAMLVDDGGKAVTSSECPNCHRLFCAQCKVAWHSGMNCKEFKSLKKGDGNSEDIMLMQLAKNKKWRRCPKCNFFVEKSYGCRHIRCRCGNHFCYRCGKTTPYDGIHDCTNPRGPFLIYLGAILLCLFLAYYL